MILLCLRLRLGCSEGEDVVAVSFSSDGSCCHCLSKRCVVLNCCKLMF